MTQRLQDLIVAQIGIAIEGMDIPQVVKDQAECEVVPFLAAVKGGGAELRYMIGVGLPSSAGDVHFVLQPLEDAHDQAEIHRVTRWLFGEAQNEAAEADLRFQAEMNGDRRTPAGLIVTP